jgi:hypothetical protein
MDESPEELQARPGRRTAAKSAARRQAAVFFWSRSAGWVRLRD